MSRIRSVLVSLTAAWLSVHLLAMAGPAILVLAGSAPSDIICTCAHGADHGSCPMHGRSTDSTRCRLQSTQHDLAALVVSLLGPLVLPTTVAVVSLDAPSRDLIRYHSPFPASWIVPPEPPPPRS